MPTKYSSPLFRHEASEVPTPKLDQSPLGLASRVKTIFGCSVAIVLISGLGAIFVEVPTVKSYEARLISDQGLPMVVSPYPAVVSELSVRVGESVQVGQKIASITAIAASFPENEDADHHSAIMREIQLQKKIIAERFESERTRGRSRVEMALLSEANSLEKAELLESRLRLSEARYDRLVRAGDAAAIPHADLEVIADGIVVLKLQLNEAKLQSNESAANQEQARVEMEVLEHQKNLQLSDLRRAMIEAQESVATNRGTLAAISAGYVASLPVQVNQLVGAGEPVAIINPTGSVLLVEIRVPASQLDGIRPGQTCEFALPNEGRGTKTYRGEILEVPNVVVLQVDHNSPDRQGEVDAEPSVWIRASIDLQDAGRTFIPGIPVSAKVFMRPSKLWQLVLGDS